MRKTMKQKIEITGKNIADIFKLPCVEAISKIAGDESLIAVILKCGIVDVWPSAYIGDTLIERDDGTWYIERHENNKPKIPY